LISIKETFFGSKISFEKASNLDFIPWTFKWMNYFLGLFLQLQVKQIYIAWISQKLFNDFWRIKNYLWFRISKKKTFKKKIHFILLHNMSGSYLNTMLGMSFNTVIKIYDILNKTELEKLLKYLTHTNSKSFKCFKI